MGPCPHPWLVRTPALASKRDCGEVGQELGQAPLGVGLVSRVPWQRPLGSLQGVHRRRRWAEETLKAGGGPDLRHGYLSRPAPPLQGGPVTRPRPRAGELGKEEQRAQSGATTSKTGGCGTGGGAEVALVEAQHRRSARPPPPVPRGRRRCAFAKGQGAWLGHGAGLGLGRSSATRARAAGITGRGAPSAASGAACAPTPAQCPRLQLGPRLLGWQNSGGNTSQAQGPGARRTQSPSLCPCWGQWARASWGGQGQAGAPGQQPSCPQRLPWTWPWTEGQWPVN